LRRQNQYYSNERDRLRGVLETIKKQNRDLADKIKEIKNYQENVPEYKKMVCKFPEQFISLSAPFASFKAYFECLGSSGSLNEGIETREEPGHFLIRQY
jgi:hypothetical protein